MLEYVKKFFLKKTNESESIFNSWDSEKFDGNLLFSSKWIFSDDEETYLKIGNRKYGIDDITYHINENGFRIPQENYNDKENTISCFGCSQTFGIGVKWEETWPYLLGEMFGGEYCVKNYGLSGASNDMISRLIYNYTLKHKPKIICCFLPEIFRMELIEDVNDFMLNFSHNFYKLLIIDKKYKDLKVDDKFFKFFNSYRKISTEKNCIYNFLKNVKFIETICENKNIQLYWCSWSDFVLNSDNSKFNSLYYMPLNINSFENDKGRDNFHNGLNFNKSLSEHFFNKINKI
jgi:hypothetical protein